MMTPEIISLTHVIANNAPINKTPLYWPIISVTELLIILFLILKKYSNKHKKLDHSPLISTSTKEEDINISDFRNEKSSEINMDELIESISKAKELYKHLSNKCHPDRFLDPDKNNKANVIFQQIVNSQRNYQKLLKIKDLAQKELGISL